MKVKVTKNWRYGTDGERNDYVDFGYSVGQVVDFYGVSDDLFKLDNHVFEAMENEDDGYRSSLDGIYLAKGGNFPRHPLTKVRILDHVPEEVREDDRIRLYGDFDGWCLQDIHTDKAVLIVGTDNAEDYYPSYTFVNVEDQMAAGPGSVFVEDWIRLEDLATVEDMDYDGWHFEGVDDWRKEGDENLEARAIELARNETKLVIIPPDKYKDQFAKMTLGYRAYEIYAENRNSFIRAWPCSITDVGQKRIFLL